MGVLLSLLLCMRNLRPKKGEVACVDNELYDWQEVVEPGKDSNSVTPGLLFLTTMLQLLRCTYHELGASYVLLMFIAAPCKCSYWTNFALQKPVAPECSFIYVTSPNQTGKSIRSAPLPSLSPLLPGWSFAKVFSREDADGQGGSESFWELRPRNSSPIPWLRDRVSGRRRCVASNSDFPAIFESSACRLQLFLVAMTADVTFLSWGEKKGRKEKNHTWSSVILEKICSPDLSSFACIVGYTLRKLSEWYQKGISRELAKSASSENLYALCMWWWLVRGDTGGGRQYKIWHKLSAT